ncbi:hypothetical protein [Paracraurococcus lichenis]|uniref:Glycosyltransferase RgtA/B/C/D-like domain-containing protein n=1 Tax=Paracraurococcus lichenis TaxID=3064888 RepID=A0ABT9DVU8_9PROT|nr:hypothetical protein [Paracraurococcus sp. LOR1-02]MDO9708013.1 hypothetical protein [Paracraurococcus sp. LOR1-02]
MSTALSGVPRQDRARDLSGWAPPLGGAGRLALILLVGAVAFLPFLLVGRFPSQDGPAHVQTASSFALLQAGQAPVSALFMVVNDPGPTNNLAPWLLSRLLEWLPPARAEWALALAEVALLLAAVLFGLRQMRGRLADAALGVLLCAPVLLYMGSHSLVLAMAFGFAALAFAARHLETGRAAEALGFLAASVLACAGNIQAAIPILAAVLGGLGGSLAWRRLRGGRLRPARTEISLALATLPLIGLVLVYKLVLGGAEFGVPLWWPQRAASALLLRGDVAWFWYSDWMLLGLLACTLWALAAWWLLRGAEAVTPASPAPWALWGGFSIAVLSMLAPTETALVPQIPMRLTPFAHYLVFLWFCGAPLPLPARRAVIGLAAAAGIGLTVTRSLGHVELAGRLAELDWAERQVPDGAVMEALRMTFLGGPFDQLPGQQIHGFRLRFGSLIHTGYGFVGRDVANLSDYQLMSDWHFFRLRPAPAVEALPGIGQADEILRAGGIPGGFAGHRAELRAATGRDIDYVLFMTQGMDVPERAKTWPPLADVLRDLEAGYERLARSAPTGLVEVWRRRDLPMR